MCIISDIMASVRRPAPFAVQSAAAQIGAHMATWRKMQRLTAQQVAERAGVSRSSVSKVENGDSSVGFETILRISRALGVLQQWEDALDPLATDLGRARAEERLPKRVRS